MKPKTFFRVECVGRHPRRFDPTDGYRLQFCGGGAPLGMNYKTWEAAQEAARRASYYDIVYAVERMAAQPGSYTAPLMRWQCFDRFGHSEVMVIEEAGK